MLNPDSIEKIKSAADEVSRREGCFFYDLEFVGSLTNRILRVYIDSESGQVSVEQCANVSKGLSLLLDVEDLVPGGAYELEVSSPGVERILRLPWHFKTALGKDVKVITHDAIPELKGETKSVEGQLLSTADDGLTLKYGSENIQIPFVNVKRAQTIFGYVKNDKKR
jgi:ribosome maturation factor RimP